jgi:hypothetical protein
MVKKKSTVATVFGILQIIFGSLSIFGPLLYFAGAQQALANWQSGLAKAPGQPDISQARIIAEIAKRLPWYKTFEVSMESADLLLCAMMIAGGIGLLQMQKWAHRLTIAYALLSILYTVAVTVCMTAITPVQMDVMIELMREQINAMPGPGPAAGGGPDPIQFFESMKPVVVGLSATCVGLMAIYPIIVLIFMLVPSVRAAFSGVPLPEEPEDYDDRYRDEYEREPDDLYRGDDPTEPDDRFRPGDR